MTKKQSPNQEILHSLRTQQQRILEFQKSSYQWHLRHHENIKTIMKGLSKLLEFSGYDGMKLELVEEDSKRVIGLEDECKRDHEPDFNDRIQVSLNDPSKLNDIFLSMTDIRDICSLRESYFELGLAFVPRWLENLTDPNKLKISLLYLWAGKDHFYQILSRCQPVICQVLRIFEQKLKKDHIMLVEGVTIEQVKELYNALNKVAD